MEQFFNIINATVHNLKGVSAKIPKHSLTCLVGKSGSGKSSFGIDVLLRACIDGSSGENSKENIVLGAIPAIAVKQRLEVGRHLCSVAKYLGLTDYLIRQIDSSSLCPHCDGNGTTNQLLPDRVIISPKNPTLKAVHPLLRSFMTSSYNKISKRIKDIPFCELSSSSKFEFFYGSPENPMWQGVQNELLLALEDDSSGSLDIDLHSIFYAQVTCGECSGYGVTSNKAVLDAALSKYTESLPLGKCLDAYFFNDLIPLGQPVAHLCLGQLQWVRILLALQKTYSNMLVLFDEPAAGMCKTDAYTLVGLCKLLVNNKCTVIVIEHSPHVILNADFILEFGPGGGSEGGEIVFSGSGALFRNERQYLFSGLNRNVQWARTQKPTSFLTVKGVNDYGLGFVELNLPDFRWTCIAGNISSGKTGSIDIINRAVDKSPSAWMGRIGLDTVTGRNKFRRPNIVDQKPIGLNPHSIPLTYIDAMTRLRDVYSSTHKAVLKKMGPEWFSFNTPKGRCSKCKGYGCVENKDDVESYWIVCDSCNGLRYNKESLQIEYLQKSIGEILNLTVSDAKRLFTDEPIIARKLEFLEKAGLGYLVIGQPSNTLSGGEAQRVKIARHLSKKLGDKTLYLLDTPSRGLSCSDIGFLVDVFKEFTNKNTVVIADNHPSFVLGCDWLIVLEKNNGVSRTVFTGHPKDASNKILDKIIGCYKI